MSEIVPWVPPRSVPVVRRAKEMAIAAAAVRVAENDRILATPLPTAEPDEVLIVIFHREFPNPQNRDVLKRYTYVAHWRAEPRRWYLSQDPNMRPIRPLTNRELLLFARPTGPPQKLSGLSLTHPPIYTSTWFLPTQAAR